MSDHRATSIDLGVVIHRVRVVTAPAAPRERPDDRRARGHEPPAAHETMIERLPEFLNIRRVEAL